MVSSVMVSPGFTFIEYVTGLGSLTVAPANSIITRLSVLISFKISGKSSAGVVISFIKSLSSYMFFKKSYSVVLLSD